MGNFKDQMAADMAVIFNLDEFAQMHDINGQQVNCIVDIDSFKVRPGGEQQQYDGIFYAVKKLFVKVADLPKRPRQGKKFSLDDEPYVVIDCAEQDGVFEITIGLNAI